MRDLIRFLYILSFFISFGVLSFRGITLPLVGYFLIISFCCILVIEFLLFIFKSLPSNVSILFYYLYLLYAFWSVWYPELPYHEQRIKDIYSKIPFIHSNPKLSDVINMFTGKDPELPYIGAYLYIDKYLYDDMGGVPTPVEFIDDPYIFRALEMKIADVKKRDIKNTPVYSYILSILLYKQDKYPIALKYYNDAKNSNKPLPEEVKNIIPNYKNALDKEIKSYYWYTRFIKINSIFGLFLFPLFITRIRVFSVPLRIKALKFKANPKKSLLIERVVNICSVIFLDDSDLLRNKINLWWLQCCSAINSKSEQMDKMEKVVREAEEGLIKFEKDDIASEKISNSKVGEFDITLIKILKKRAEVLLKSDPMVLHPESESKFKKDGAEMESKILHYELSEQVENDLNHFVHTVAQLISTNVDDKISNIGTMSEEIKWGDVAKDIVNKLRDIHRWQGVSDTKVGNVLADFLCHKYKNRSQDDTTENMAKELYKILREKYDVRTEREKEIMENTTTLEKSIQAKAVSDIYVDKKYLI